MFESCAVKTIFLLQVLAVFSDISCFCQQHPVCSLNLNAFHTHQHCCDIKHNFQEIIRMCLTTLWISFWHIIKAYSWWMQFYLRRSKQFFCFVFKPFCCIFFLNSNNNDRFCVLHSKSSLPPFLSVLYLLNNSKVCFEV